MSESEMIAEPDWLAAEPSARAKLTAIMAAVRRCYAECTEPQLTPATGPHLSTTMAELFIGQLLMTATDDAGDLTPAGMYLAGVKAERERIRPLVDQWRRAADSLRESNAAWSSHFHDCANELERLLEES